MSRLSRANAAKSCIAIWRWLHAQPTAPIVTGTYEELRQRLNGVGNVSSDKGVADRLRLMAKLGLLRTEVVHEGGGRGQYPVARASQHLLVDVEAGAKTIGTWFAKGGYLKVDSKNNRRLLSERAASVPINTETVAIRTDDEDRPVEAVVGPDAPSPFEALRELRKNEPGALVAAARQYAHRQDFVLERLTEIEQLGVKIDRDKIMKAIHLDRDDEFEGIVKVLPYIDELEARAKQAENWRNELVSVRAELNAARIEKNRLTTEVQRQKDANQRLATKMAQDAVRQPQVLVGDR